MTYYEVSIHKPGLNERERQVISTPELSQALAVYKKHVSACTEDFWGPVVRFRAVIYYPDGDVSMRLVRRLGV